MRSAVGGFSLMELVVVLAVLALAVAVVGPAVDRTAASLRARAEVGAVAAFLRSTREQAAARRQALEVIVDRDAHALVVRRPGRDGAAAALRRLAVGPTLRIAADPPPPRVTFFPHGASSGARFAIAARGADSYVIAVDALTGRVSMRRAGS
ncbi:MAG TPA: GspH/FimT family pseudopilin [Candidatus Deferrimicrobiaceae bacterium]|nr:GspH/FimT family pseudopilin [Candidatus Deferrimicrobiaceae bacterium]